MRRLNRPPATRLPFGFKQTNKPLKSILPGKQQLQYQCPALIATHPQRKPRINTLSTPLSNHSRENSSTACAPTTSLTNRRIMAPSRAFKRLATSATQPPAQSSAPPHIMHNIRSAYARTCNYRPISTLSARTRTHTRTPSTPIATGHRQARSWAQKDSPISQQRQSRSYSSPSADSGPDAVQPPDYLNEKELHVFNKIKAELEPVRLEVRPGEPSS